MKYITPASVIIEKHNMQKTLANADLMFFKGDALVSQLNIDDGLNSLIQGVEIYRLFEKYPNYLYYYSHLLAIATIYTHEELFLSEE